MKSVTMFAQISFTVILITGSILIVNYYKDKDQRTLAEKNEQLSEENEQLQAENDYVLSKDRTVDNSDFDQWSYLEDQAEAFHKDSDEEFKKPWALFMVKQSEKYEVDPVVVYELLKVETGDTFNPKLVGPETKYGKAYGIGQFMKNTAPWIADMAGLRYEEELLFDPYYSMQLAVVYLDYLYNKYNNWDEALTAYHRGVGGLKKYKEENGDAESWYAVEIQSKADSHETIAAAN
ncbi:lytic transglycosylase domain-containing protein [Halobacillus sp. A5]|uniref:lytic transglycosylase domain-containing protein n=1 Tax=Halobacillus sp. A5 TaxID=2880263 RepID=UPI0020A63D2D|nr:transglycosylase SLT domain-containing protein [Halobacillus sp. A5]MCP3025662.1 lytic transglycosylase domain-containing protein [Halobacillus sp. A5]